MEEMEAQAPITRMELKQEWRKGYKYGMKMVDHWEKEVKHRLLGYRTFKSKPFDVDTDDSSDSGEEMPDSMAEEIADITHHYQIVRLWQNMLQGCKGRS